jgi:hypothetical protein
VKTSKEELRRRKAEAQWQDEERRRIEALIEQGRVEILPLQEYHARYANPLDPLDNVLLAAPRPSPAMQFLIEKLNGVSPERVDAALWQGIIDLMASRIPLDDRTRVFIAAEMQKLVYPEVKKKAAIGAKLRHIEETRAWLTGRGDSHEEADNKIAKELGHNSGEALRKWIRRERRKV